MNTSDLYSMLNWAKEKLDDHEYVDQFGGEPALIDHLETTAFAYLKGMWSLRSMLCALAANPEYATWEKHGFSVQTMIDLAATRTKDAGDCTRVNWKTMAQQYLCEIAALRESVDVLASFIAKGKTA